MGLAGRDAFGGTPLWNGGSARGVRRSGAPCESPQAGRSAAAGRDSVLRRQAAGILGLVKDEYFLEQGRGEGLQAVCEKLHGQLERRCWERAVIRGTIPAIDL
jgi:hypothetical protein